MCCSCEAQSCGSKFQLGTRKRGATRRASAPAAAQLKLLEIWPHPSVGERGLTDTAVAAPTPAVPATCAIPAPSSLPLPGAQRRLGYIAWSTPRAVAPSLQWLQRKRIKSSGTSRTIIHLHLLTMCEPGLKLRSFLQEQTFNSTAHAASIMLTPLQLLCLQSWGLRRQDRALRS